LELADFVARDDDEVKGYIDENLRKAKSTTERVELDDKAGLIVMAC
jgi:hypothetical protein